MRFQQALKKDPAITVAINGLGVIYLNRRQLERAEAQFKKLLQINPRYIDAYNQLGIIYIEKKEYDKAKQHLLTAANAEKYRTPENAYLNLANLEMRRKRPDAALRYVEKGIKANKFFAPLYNVKGLILEGQRKYEDALYNYKKSLNLLEEENVFYLINMGRVLGFLGRKSKALDALERALVKAPSKNLKDQIQQLIKALEKN
jgi:superkiller protein 3